MWHNLCLSLAYNNFTDAFFCAYSFYLCSILFSFLFIYPVLFFFLSLYKTWVFHSSIICHVMEFTLYKCNLCCVVYWLVWIKWKRWILLVTLKIKRISSEILFCWIYWKLKGWLGTFCVFLCFISIFAFYLNFCHLAYTLLILFFFWAKWINRTYKPKNRKVKEALNIGNNKNYDKENATDA